MCFFKIRFVQKRGTSSLRKPQESLSNRRYWGYPVGVVVAVESDKVEDGGFIVVDRNVGFVKGALPYLLRELVQRAKG